MEDRYMIYNNVKKKIQFPSICETTEKGAKTCLFKMIGNDARKWRFDVIKLKKERAYEIRKSLKYENKAKRIKETMLNNIPYNEILALVIRNENINKGE